MKPRTDRRRVRGSLLPTFAALLALTASCTAKSPGSGTASCAERTQSASAAVLRVVDANGACAVDADCAVVGVSARCFDVCTRAVSTAGEEAVRRAIADVEAGECKTFEADGCAVQHPPCAPPGAPVCRSGRCSE